MAKRLGAQSKTQTMRYLEIKAAPWPQDPRPPWWMRLLLFIVPAGNPDLEKYYIDIEHWWLEISDAGEPLREIGFDANGKAIVLAPVEGNFGMLIDASDDWSGSDGDSIEAAERFEAVWQELWPTFSQIDRRNRRKP